MPMSHFWSRPKYSFAVLASAPDRCSYWEVNALLQDCAKSVMNGVPDGSVSPLSLWKVMPSTVNVFGQATGLVGVSTPALSSAVVVMTFIVDPGETSAVSAKSLKPSLLAMARILPVDGWMTTIELCLCMPTAACAAASAVELIVVATDCTSSGSRMAAWLFLTGAPAVVWISTSRPGLPWPGGADFISRFAMLVSPGSL